jgi:hypothetical protein
MQHELVCDSHAPYDLEILVLSLLSEISCTYYLPCQMLVLSIARCCCQVQEAYVCSARLV